MKRIWIAICLCALAFLLAGCESSSGGDDYADDTPQRAKHWLSHSDMGPAGTVTGKRYVAEKNWTTRESKYSCRYDFINDKTDCGTEYYTQSHHEDEEFWLEMSVCLDQTELPRCVASSFRVHEKAYKFAERGMRYEAGRDIFFVVDKTNRTQTPYRQYQ